MKSYAKFIGIVLILIGLALYGDALALVIREPHRLRRRRVRALHRGCRLGRWLLGLRTQIAIHGREDGHAPVKARPPHATPLAPPGALVVANHLSYLDIITIAACQPTAFITSTEVRDTPFVGWLTRAMGCLYVERRSRAFLPVEIREIAGVLEAGISVTLFPEGTSSDGERVLPFRAALFDTARDAHAPIAPICVSYPEFDGQRFRRENHDLICYYGEDELFAHLLRLLSLRSIEARIEILPLTYSEAHGNRYALAAALHEQIAERFPGYGFLNTVGPGTAAGDAYSDAISPMNC